MKNIRFCTLIAFMVFFQGCSVNKQLIPTGGSRADGIVKLSYEYGLFEQPVLNPQQGYQAAKQRCIAWGYTDTEAFGGQITQCINFNRNGCNRWIATLEFQCTGADKPK